MPSCPHRSCHSVLSLLAIHSCTLCLCLQTERVLDYGEGFRLDGNASGDLARMIDKIVAAWRRCGKTHNAELYYVFGDKAAFMAISMDERAMSDAMDSVADP